MAVYGKQNIRNEIGIGVRIEKNWSYYLRIEFLWQGITFNGTKNNDKIIH